MVGGCIKREGEREGERERTFSEKEHQGGYKK
jgi:hypothetical protein